MTILQANLKHLYQRRSFWLLWLFLVFVVFIIIVTVAKGQAGAFLAFIGWMFFWGTLAAQLQIDVLTKPFSYCLPQHPEIPRKFLFYTGLTVSFLMSAIFLIYPALDFTEMILTCVSVFSVGTILYWFGVWIVFRYPSWNYSLGFLALVIVAGRILNVHIIISRIITHYHFPIIIAGGLVNLWAWIHWGREGLARQYCGRMWMGPFDAWDREKLSKYQEARLVEKQKDFPVHILPKIETFFISRISGAGENLSRYIWGGFYKSFGVMLSCRNGWIGALTGTLLMVLFLGYISRGSNILFIMPVFLALQATLHVHSPLLISGGRRERFWTALALGTAATLLITVFLILMALITLWLEPIMPVLTLNGRHFNFMAIGINLSLMTLFVLPIAFTIGLVFDKKPMIKMIVMMLVFQALFIFLILNPSNQRFVFTPAKIIALLLCSWVIFVSVSRYICMKCSLVK